MLIVSVGTGSAPMTGPAFEGPDRSIQSQFPGLISGLMYGADVDQDINCRTLGRWTFGGVIDSESEMIPPRGTTERDSDWRTDLHCRRFR